VIVLVVVGAKRLAMESVLAACSRTMTHLHFLLKHRTLGTQTHNRLLVLPNTAPLGRAVAQAEATGRGDGAEESVFEAQRRSEAVRMTDLFETVQGGAAAEAQKARVAKDLPIHAVID